MIDSRKIVGGIKFAVGNGVLKTLDNWSWQGLPTPSSAPEKDIWTATPKTA